MLRIIGHLLVTLFKVFWRIVFAALFCAAAGVGAVLLVTYIYTGNTLHWPPSSLTLALMVGVGALAGYAGAVTVLMVEAVRALKTAAHAVEAEAVAPIKAVGQELEGSKR